VSASIAHPHKKSLLYIHCEMIGVSRYLALACPYFDCARGTPFIFYTSLKGFPFQQCFIFKHSNRILSYPSLLLHSEGVGLPDV
jgi:hypothetical protein